MKKIVLTFIAIAMATVSAMAQEEVTAQDVQAAATEAAAALTAAEETPAPAPKPRYWTNSLQTNINFGQTALVNWAAGGYSNMTLAAFIDANANYAKGKFKWDNRLQLDYGFLYSFDKPIIQKYKDRIYLQSNAALDTPIQNLFYSADFSFKTQFGRNYNYKTPPGLDAIDEHDTKALRAAWRDARELTMSICSPAYITLGLGIKWTPKPWFTLNFAPLTGGVVIVAKPELRDMYSMDVKKSRLNDYNNWISFLNNEDNKLIYDTYKENEAALETATEQEKATYYDYKREKGYIDKGDYLKPYRFELGAQLKIDAKVDINDNFTYSTQIVAFYNYLKPKQEPRITWDNRIFWKMAKYFSLTLSTNLIYDPEVKIPYEFGTKKQQAKMDAAGTTTFKGVQFKEFLELGFTYTIASKKD
ncbi:MAG: DUF3078 domain-containing protein [Bacteroidales bacterium]|nr:DUF3078 domain-containing protein [Bacteroidales bacterium]